MGAMFAVSISFWKNKKKIIYPSLATRPVPYWETFPVPTSPNFLREKQVDT